MPDNGTHAYAATLYDFINEVLVQCPRCGRQALVRRLERGARLTCTHCGHYRQTSGRRRHFFFHGHHAGLLPEWSVTIVGGPYDPYFRVPLWLTGVFEGQVLWAYNAAHLRLLENHIAATHRSRATVPHRNRSIGSRLPGWMSAAGNRRRMLKAFARIGAKLESA